MLRFVIKPLFEAQLGDWLLDSPRLVPAIIFYLFYIGGLLVFVSWPALRADCPLQALFYGALLGALAYGTYEFTNLATLTRWSPVQVVVDVIWGTCLTGTAAWLGVLITKRLST
jgi:uncharacterized membrane protein